MFKFKLESLLKYRRQKEDLAKVEFAKRIREAEDIEKKLAEIRDRTAEIYEETGPDQGESVQALTYIMYRDYVDQLRKKEAKAANLLLQAQQRVEKYRPKLVQASVDRKIIDRYKEKQKEAYEKEKARQESINLDELAALSQSRRKNEV